jgi:AcrR family transcriptional regulator
MKHSDSDSDSDTAGYGRKTQAQRRDQTRAKLLAAATDLFSRNGYHRTQVMDIVTRARVSAGTFYRYFDDKQGIFQAIAEELSDHEVDEAQKTRSMPWEAADFASEVRGMVQFFERHFERVVRRAALYRAMDNSGRVDLRRDHSTMREHIVKALTEHLSRTGVKDTEDLESLARMIRGVISELRHSMMLTGKPTPAQAARLVTRFVQGGMAAYTTRHGLFSDEWREVLEREAKT